MNMKNLIVVFFALLSYVGQAQSEASWTSLLSNSTTRSISDAAVGQLNLDQSAFLADLSQKEGVSLYVNGSFNNITVSNQGTNSKVRAVQNGSRNAMNINAAGNDNKLSLSQNGDNNNLNMMLLFGDGLQMQVQQMGNSNGITSVGTPSVYATPIRIEQSGGMQISITQN